MPSSHTIREHKSQKDNTTIQYYRHRHPLVNESELAKTIQINYPVHFWPESELDQENIRATRRDKVPWDRRPTSPPSRTSDKNGERGHPKPSHIADDYSSRSDTPTREKGGRGTKELRHTGTMKSRILLPRSTEVKHEAETSGPQVPGDTQPELLLSRDNIFSPHRSWSYSSWCPSEDFTSDTLETNDQPTGSKRWLRRVQVKRDPSIKVSDRIQAQKGDLCYERWDEDRYTNTSAR